MSTFNDSNIKSFRKDFDQAVKHLQEQYGVKIQIGTISYDDMKFTSRLTVSQTGTDNLGRDLTKIEWDKSCIYFGFEKQDFGKTFIDNNKKYTIVGIKPRSKKYPICIIDQNGKKYSAPSEMVKRLLGSSNQVSTIEKPLDNSEKPNFERLCSNYGFEKEDYRAIFTGPSGGKYYLVGFFGKKGVLLNKDNNKKCNVDIIKIKKSLVRQTNNLQIV